MDGCCHSEVHDDFSELEELLALERLGEKIGNHVISWAMIDVNFSLFDLIFDEEVVDIDAFCPLAAAQLPVLFQQNGRLVVLIQNCVIRLVALSF